MLVHNRMDSSEANGPGKRAVLWLQGCSLGCVGCWNPETHLFHEKNRVSIGEIQDWIKGLKDVEGITFSGGEPMQQAPYLYALVHWIRENRPDLTIGMYTGYNLRELENGSFKWHSAEDAEWRKGSKQLWAEIKKHLDFAIVGRYVQSMACHEEPLRGSRNQDVLFFTKRYQETDLPEQFAEVSVEESGSLIQITGYPTVEFLDGMRTDRNAPTSRTPVPCIKDSGDSGEELVGV